MKYKRSEKHAYKATENGGIREEFATNTSREEAGLQEVGSCIVVQGFADVSKHRSAFNIQGLSSQTTLRRK
jgi:hypothetical protein